MTVRSTVLEDTKLAAWLELIQPYAKAEGSISIRTSEEFAVTIGDEEVVVPVGTELVFYHNLKGQYRGTTQPFRTEGVFYLSGATLAIKGFFGRKIPKGREAQYARKVAEYRQLDDTSSSGTGLRGLMAALV